MSRKSALVIAVFALITSAACTKSDPWPGSQAVGSNSASQAPSPGETFAQLIALDQHAIARAEQAKEKDVGEPLRALVDNMHVHHRRNLTQTRAVADSAGVDIAKTPAIRARRAEDDRKLAELAGYDGEPYSHAYLEAVMESHMEALGLIDSYLQSADNEAIRAHLERTRANFAEHLETARSLLES